jgi:hypothetical protein
MRARWLLSLSFGLLLLGLSFAVVGSAAAAPMSEQEKIEALIHGIEVLPGAHFIRNGSEYDGKAAAEHLISKRRYAGSDIKTAGDFITLCASHSSMSGKPYQIRFADGRTVDSEVYFRAELKRIEAQDAVPPQKSKS